MEKAMEAFLGQFDRGGEDRDQKSDVRGQMSEDATQTPDVSGQKSVLSL